MFTARWGRFFCAKPLFWIKIVAISDAMGLLLIYISV